MIVLKLKRPLRVRLFRKFHYIDENSAGPAVARPAFSHRYGSLPAADEVFVAPVRVVAVVIVIRAMTIVPRRANAYGDTARSRIETNLCRGRQSRSDRDCRHKRNSKLPHDCLLCWSHS